MQWNLLRASTAATEEAVIHVVNMKCDEDLRSRRGQDLEQKLLPMHRAGFGLHSAKPREPAAARLTGIGVAQQLA